jgi:hypothetical protein
MKNKSLILFSILVVLNVGCSNVRVPTSSYDLGTVKLALPKNITAKNIEVSVKSGTNTLIFKAAYITSRNDPNVIAATAEGQLEMVKEHYAGAAKLSEIAIEAASKSAVPKP